MHIDVIKGELETVLVRANLIQHIIIQRMKVTPQSSLNTKKALGGGHLTADPLTFFSCGCLISRRGRHRVMLC